MGNKINRCAPGCFLLSSSWGKKMLLWIIPLNYVSEGYSCYKVLVFIYASSFVDPSANQLLLVSEAIAWSGRFLLQFVGLYSSSSIF